MENKIAILTGIIGAAVFYMFDIVGVAVSILVLFMLADYITGLMAAAMNKELNSRIGWKGFARKLYILILVGTIYVLDFMALHYTGMDIFGGKIGDGAAFAYIAIELISITENGIKMKVPMPPYIIQIIKVIKDKTGMKEGEK